jgi:hypothetical protein
VELVESRSDAERYIIEDRLSLKQSRDPKCFHAFPGALVTLLSNCPNVETVDTSRHWDDFLGLSFGSPALSFGRNRTVIHEDLEKFLIELPFWIIFLKHYNLNLKLFIKMPSFSPQYTKVSWLGHRAWP